MRAGVVAAPKAHELLTQLSEQGVQIVGVAWPRAYEARWRELKNRREFRLRMTGRGLPAEEEAEYQAGRERYLTVPVWFQHAI